MTALTGKVKMLATEDRGFGFIAGADARDYFFHRTDLVSGVFEDLREGDAIEFEAVTPQPPKGARAKNLRPAEPAEAATTRSTELREKEEAHG